MEWAAVGVATLCLLESTGIGLILLCSRKNAQHWESNTYLALVALGTWFQAIDVFFDGESWPTFLVQDGGLLLQLTILALVALRNDRLCVTSSTTRAPDYHRIALVSVVVVAMGIWILLILTAAVFQVEWTGLVEYACKTTWALLTWCFATLCYLRIMQSVHVNLQKHGGVQRSASTIEHLVRKSVVYVLLLLVQCLIVITAAGTLVLNVLSGLQLFIYAWSNEAVQMRIYGLCPCWRHCSCCDCLRHYELTSLRGKRTVVRMVLPPLAARATASTLLAGRPSPSPPVSPSPVATSPPQTQPQSHPNQQYLLNVPCPRSPSTSLPRPRIQNFAALAQQHGNTPQIVITPPILF